MSTWVKATDRMPEHHTVFAKVSSKYEVLYCYGGTFYTELGYSRKFPDACIDQVQWLDESEEPNQEEQGEMISDLGSMYTEYSFSNQDWDDFIKEVGKKYQLIRK